MAVYTGPKCRLCRREGVRLFLKGDRCYSVKCGVEKRKYPPGQHGQAQRKVEEYGLQLREKQKLKRIYWMKEKPFRNYYDEAVRRKGRTGEVLLRLLETRLDNVVYRMGFAPNRRTARQLVSHGHLLLNGRRVTIPSIQVRPGDVIGVRERSKSTAPFLNVGRYAGGRRIPEWLDFDAKNLQGRMVSHPNRDHIDTDVHEQLIVEFYSR
jgi:small subunit ribosomal protein S4